MEGSSRGRPRTMNSTELSPWLRVLAAHLRQRASDVAFVGFPPAFECLAKASHPSFCSAQFMSSRKLPARIASGLTIVQKRSQAIEIQITAGSRAGAPDNLACSVQAMANPVEMLCDLVFLLNISGDEGCWTVEGERDAGGVFDWKWRQGNDTGADEGIHAIRRYVMKRSDFRGEVLDNQDPVNHRFPDGFFTLGTKCFHCQAFSGGTLAFNLDLPRLRHVRRAYLAIVWPPFHGRGLIASKRSGEKFVGMRLGKQSDPGRIMWLARCPCSHVGYHGRYHPQMFTRESLRLVVSSPNALNASHLRLVLRITPNACLDIYRLSLHLFGEPAKR